jgi:hypothetical protein
MAHWSDYDEREERESHLATPAEAVAEFAANIGGEYPDRAWLLHDWDVWVKNPAYAGPPVPHPESYDEEDDFIGPRQPYQPRPLADDDIPF